MHVDSDSVATLGSVDRVTYDEPEKVVGVDIKDVVAVSYSARGKVEEHTSFSIPPQKVKLLFRA